MKIVELYRYENDDGSISISPEKRNEVNIEYKYRLIANEGQVITDGENIFYCIDTDDIDQYFEIDAPEDNEIISEKAEAFDYITGAEN